MQQSKAEDRYSCETLLPMNTLYDHEHCLTQEDVAKVLHVSQNTYSQYEIGVSRYPLDAIIKLAEYYGVSIDYLVGLTDEPKPYPRKKK